MYCAYHETKMVVAKRDLPIFGATTTYECTICREEIDASYERLRNKDVPKVQEPDAADDDEIHRDGNDQVDRGQLRLHGVPVQEDRARPPHAGEHEQAP